MFLSSQLKSELVMLCVVKELDILTPWCCGCILLYCVLIVKGVLRTARLQTKFQCLGLGLA